MKRIATLIASQTIFGIVCLYAAAAFISVSFAAGLLMKYGVIRTPGVVKRIVIAITQISWSIAQYVGGILIHLATNPLDLLFTVLAGSLIGMFLLQFLQAPKGQASYRPKSLPIRGSSIQSLSVVEQQLADRRRRAQAQLNEQYAKHTLR
jgi:hypothetical protein